MKKAVLLILFIVLLIQLAKGQSLYNNNTRILLGANIILNRPWEFPVSCIWLREKGPGFQLKVSKCTTEHRFQFTLLPYQYAIDLNWESRYICLNPGAILYQNKFAGKRIYFAVNTPLAFSNEVLMVDESLLTGKRFVEDHVFISVCGELVALFDLGTAFVFSAAVEAGFKVYGTEPFAQAQLSKEQRSVYTIPGLPGKDNWGLKLGLHYQIPRRK